VCLLGLKTRKIPLFLLIRAKTGESFFNKATYSVWDFAVILFPSWLGFCQSPGWAVISFSFPTPLKI
jgi:hypothetical protein